MNYYEYKFKSMCAVRAKPYIVINIQKANKHTKSKYTWSSIEYIKPGRLNFGSIIRLCAKIITSQQYNNPTSNLVIK